MKKIMTYIMAGCMALSMNSCLDLEPTSELVDNNFWKNKEQFSAFNVGLQGLFRQKGYQLIELGELRSNIYAGTPFSGESPSGYSEIYNNMLSTTNTGISDFAGFYTTINQINLMIDKCNNTSLLTDAEKNKYLGNAYGMRAFFYLQLLKSYGKAVINTVHTEGGTLDLNNTAREESTAEEVMAQIKEDIKASEDAFNGDYTFNDSRNGWSLAATKMLKGDAYLWSGNQIETEKAKQNSDFEVAKQAYQDIINAKVASLESNYSDVFAFNNKCNKEIIFAIYNGENETALWNGQYSNTLVMNQQNMGGYGLYDYDTDGYIYFKDSELAKGSGIMRVSLNKNLYDGENYASRLFRDGDTRFLGSMREVYSTKTNDWPYVGVIANKFHGTMLAGKSVISWLDDQPIYRYSECLLGLAEAKVLLGEDPTEEINAVRKRAYGETYFYAHPEIQYPNDTDEDTTEGDDESASNEDKVNFYTNNPFVGSDADPEEAVLKERCREFMFEGKRWYDIRLFNKATKYSTAVESRLYWPIDQNALGENSKLNQTDGYK